MKVKFKGQNGIEEEVEVSFPFFWAQSDSYEGNDTVRGSYKRICRLEQDGTFYSVTKRDGREAGLSTFEFETATIEPMNYLPDILARMSDRVSRATTADFAALVAEARVALTALPV